MKLIKIIRDFLNSYLVGAAAFGIASATLLIMKHPVMSAFFGGVAITKFLTAVKNLRG